MSGCVGRRMVAWSADRATSGCARRRTAARSADRATSGCARHRTAARSVDRAMSGCVGRRMAAWSADRATSGCACAVRWPPGARIERRAAALAGWTRVAVAVRRALSFVTAPIRATRSLIAIASALALIAASVRRALISLAARGAPLSFITPLSGLSSASIVAAVRSALRAGLVGRRPVAVAVLARLALVVRAAPRRALRLVFTRRLAAAAGGRRFVRLIRCVCTARWATRAEARARWNAAGAACARFARLLFV